MTDKRALFFDTAPAIETDFERRIEERRTRLDTAVNR